MAGPLQGIRVLELARVLAGPWAGQILAELGAEVIKVERPGTGDDTRAWGPPYAKDEHGTDMPGMSAYFLGTNRGKRSVTIDFAKPEGSELARRLAATADVVIENFKVGGLVQYGLDYPALSANHPQLVYASITGFGQDGPYAPRAGYDFIIQGLGGLMSISGLPGGEPMKSGIAVSDLFTGFYTAIGVLGALFEARVTGKGRHLDLALFDAQVATLSNQGMAYLVSGRTPAPMGNTHPSIVPYQVFEASDGHIIVACGNDGQFAKLCEVADRPDLAKDPRYATNPARVVNRVELVALLATLIKERPSAFWLDGLEAAGVPAGPINTIDRTFADPQAVARRLRTLLPLDGGGTVPGIASPLREAGKFPETVTAPPRLGQHTDVILQGIGLDAAEIARLRAQGVI